MSEYIERGALLQKFKPYLDDADTDALIDGLDAQFVVGVIEDETAADVVEVKHGRWREECVVGFNKAFCVTVFVCSECKKRYRVPNMNYCPNCGAKMDGE